MSDRELLELAAKAAGIDAEWHNDDDADFDAQYEGMFLKGDRSPDNNKYWNPLRNDGDALRLAVKLRLVLLLELPRIGIGPRMDGPEVYVEEDEDEYAATRRAITRAAAEIGKEMP